MKVNTIAAAILAISSAGLATQVSAESANLGIGIKAGTLGIGIEGTVPVTETLNIRAGYNGYEYDYSGTESGIEYDLDLELESGALLADWHPFNNGFRLSGGVIYNNNALDGRADPTASYDIGGTTYTSANVGTLNSKIDFDTTVPYLGLGWGNAVDAKGAFRVSAEIGVLFQGSPDVSLTADGNLSNNAAFQADLAAEEAQLESDLDEFEYYPVISLGISYSF